MIQTNQAVYAATLGEFLDDVKNNIFVEKMKDESKKRGIPFEDSQVRAWEDYGKRDSPVRSLFEKLPSDVIVCFEYRIPVGGRIDCMLFGKNKNGQGNAIHIELKQWSNENVRTYYSQYSFEVELTGRGGGKSFKSHPSLQVEEYQNHLWNYNDVLSSNKVLLSGLVYCYNYKRNYNKVDLLSEEYKDVLNRYPIYCEEDTAILEQDLLNKIILGKGLEVFELVSKSKWEPTKRLQDATANMFKGIREFEMIGEQSSAFYHILGAIMDTPKDEKVVIIVKGGPGTGKSVIALNLVSALADSNIFAYYVTRSTSLRNGFKKILKKVLTKSRNNASDIIKNTYDFKPNSYFDNEVDAIIVDEAHRIENSSNWRNQSPKNRHGGPNNIFLTQIMSLLYTSRVSVFFIDDFQAITNTNIGTSQSIKDAASNYKKRLTQEIEFFKNDPTNKNGIAYLNTKIADYNLKRTNAESIGNLKVKEEIENKIKQLEIKLDKAKEQLDFIKITSKNESIPVVEFTLPDQFRCNGSDNYLDWLNDVIYNNGKGEIKFDKNKYLFDVFDNPHEMYIKIRSLDEYACKVDELLKDKNPKPTYEEIHNYFNKTLRFKPKQTARIAAGWCWNWSDKDLAPDGDLLKEVVIDKKYCKDWEGNEFPPFEMPWETQVKPRGDFRFKYARDADMWANELEGINQVGCIFSMQGWELDYVGIIIGPDLIYDKSTNGLVATRDGGTHSVYGNDQEFDYYIKNIYRVLLTRGKKGCFIFACDPEVGKYFKRCMEK